MKTIVINASPKRKGINAQLMKSAARGAESVGADVEYIDLYKYDMHGCMSCLICKQDGRDVKCYWRDDVSSLIEKILNCDALLIGAPIFFCQPTSHYTALLERLIYCLVSYKGGNAFKGKVNVGLFYTVNYSLDYFNKSVRPTLKHSEFMLEMLNGEVLIESFENITVSEYSDSSDEGKNIVKQKEEQLSKDLDKIFNFGAELSK